MNVSNKNTQILIQYHFKILGKKQVLSSSIIKHLSNSETKFKTAKWMILSRMVFRWIQYTVVNNKTMKWTLNYQNKINNL